MAMTTGRRPRVALVVAAVVLGLAAVGVGVRALRSALAPGVCATTRSVVAGAAPHLRRGFEIAELQYDCSGTLATIEHDGARLGLTRSETSSASQLSDDVRAALRTAGWRAVGDTRRMLLRRDGTTYSASVDVNSISPAMAILRLRNLRPSLGGGRTEVPGAVPERRLTSAQRLRYVTISAFTPQFVPHGYVSWQPPRVLGYDDVASNLEGGLDVAPSLRSLAVPADYDARDCDVFTARTRGDRCVAFGTTRSGIEVRIARDAITADGLAGNAVAIVDGTLVTLLHGHNHPYVKPRLSRRDVLRIFDSLRARNSRATR